MTVEEKPVRRQATAVVRAHFSETFSGPLPPSEEFAGYERVLPGAADRILRMAEKDQDDRLTFQRALLKRKFLAEIAGMSSAVVIPLAGLGTAIVLAYLGVQGAAIAAIITAFGFPSLVKIVSDALARKSAKPNDPQMDLPFRK